jgi:hypothetical protein
MKNENPEAILAWLQTSPSLSALCERFPKEWESAQQKLGAVITNGTPSDLKDLTSSPPRRFAARRATGSGASSRSMQGTILSEQIEHRMICHAVKRYSLSVATGVVKGKVRFDLINGYLAQKLFFSEGLERKMARLFWFRLIWPLIWRKKLLMPLVESRGIYCFYSRELVASLAALIGERPCLEIAAGDGTLTRFLRTYSVQITATDNYSWNKAIHYPQDVKQIEAKDALVRFSPKVVICSWPPANNDFERHVFRTKSIQTYIVIGSRLQFASGNWKAYREQTAFTLEEDQMLGQLVLPPELGSAVYVFQRKSE